MKVLEIKNNLVKVLYDLEENKLTLSGFVVIEDEQKPYVGQVISLKADHDVTYAIVKLLFTFDEEGIVKNYDGSIPKLGTNVTSLTPAELLDILPSKKPLKLGNLAQQNFLLNVDFSMLKNQLLVCSDTSKHTSTLISNFARQAENIAESSIIFDFEGKFKSDKKFVFGKHFKLPLNFETINFIYGNDLNDIDSTSKAVIQDIFLEVQEYTRSIADKFIPFNTFIGVVDQQYKESNIPELALLKNKLLKYKEENVFAESKYEISSLKEHIKDNYTTVLDLSNVNPKLQREIVFYVYEILEDMGADIYSFIKVNDENSDKKLLKLLLADSKIHTTIICNHNYKYIYELKENANDLILFAPETNQHDFASYNIFLNKLNHDEFVIWGDATQRIPLIVELAPIEFIKEAPAPVVAQPQSVAEPEPVKEEKETIPTEETSEETAEVETPEAPVEDFTENDDTYTDLSDDVERIPQEEEDYSALHQEEESEITEEADDFDRELELEIEQDLISEPEDDIEINEEASTNDFFTQTKLQEEPEVAEQTLETTTLPAFEEIIMPNGEVIEESAIADEPVVEAYTEIAVEDEDDIIEPIASSVVQPSEFDELVEDSAIEETHYEDDIISESTIYQPEYEEVAVEPIQSNLPDPTIDERINEDLPEILVENEETQADGEEFFEDELQTGVSENELEETEDDETFESEEQIEDNVNIEDEFNEDFEQTPFENSNFPSPAPLMLENDELENEFASENIEDEAFDSALDAESLTEDDLNFIDDINNGDADMLEPVVEEPDIFKEEEEDTTPPPVPLYGAEIPKATKTFEQGEKVTHPKYGDGIVEKMIKYGDKTLCAINFASVGRRLLDPAISEIQKLYF